jgi:glutamine cyclotransferase
VKYSIRLLCLSLLAFANLISAVSHANAKEQLPTPVKPLAYQIIAERSHKPTLFTQGILVKGGYFYESSGLYNKSLIVSYPISEPESAWAKMTAPFTQKQAIPERYFAEGLTLLNNKLYLLTWKEGALFVYDANHFSLLNTLYYQGEGWGLTTDGKHLIRSDGSANLFFHNPDNFSTEKTITVSLNKEPVHELNELEFFDGFIWANIWHDNRILKIDPATGNVVGILDLSEITKKLRLTDSESVLNGIAYDADKKAVWITGKQWPKMFLLKLNN